MYDCAVSWLVSLDHALFLWVNTAWSNPGLDGFFLERHPELRGLLGRLYWAVLIPFHAVIFRLMAERIAAAAELIAERGYGGTTTSAIAERAGVTRFMTKPFSNAEMLDAVRALAGA